MKTIVMINGINYGSTGTITLNIAEQARLSGYKAYTCCKKSRFGKKFIYDDQIFIGTWLDRVVSERLAYFTGLKGDYNRINTYLFIQKLKRIKPDLVHMHLLHDTFINLDMLFDYFKKSSIPVIWTFHDCWAFTGQCSYFDEVKCSKWKTGCDKCPKIHEYPSTRIDKTSVLWKRKKECFNGLKDLTIVTPSHWLKNNVKESFLKSYETRVIYNGIDLNVFAPTQSNFRKKHNIEEKFLLLGVAYNWDHRKGVDVFARLAEELPSEFQIVMVGVKDEDSHKLPDNIIKIRKTFNQKELAEIYSASDLFINPTREDNFPTVNIESLACGTPVLTYNTGGSPEALDVSCGSVVEKEDYDGFKNKILDIAKNKPFSEKNCLERAKQFDKNNKFQEYIDLYREKLK